MAASLVACGSSDFRAMVGPVFEYQGHLTLSLGKLFYSDCIWYQVALVSHVDGGSRCERKASRVNVNVNDGVGSVSGCVVASLSI